jgi:uncharacterized membrane protein
MSVISKKLKDSTAGNERYFAIFFASVYLFLAFVSITKISIWHDESYSATIIQGSYRQIISRTALDVHPPLYYLLLKTWSVFFGDSIIALRSFSVVTMLGAILITWGILRRLFGEKKALWALLFMCIGPFLVRYGQEMRMYGFAALLTAIATAIWLRLQNTKLNRLQLAYGVVIALGMYTQYFFVLVPLVHALSVLVLEKESFRRKIVALKEYWLAAITVALLFLPWIPTVLHQFKAVYGAFWIGPVGVDTLTSTPIAMLALKKQFQMTGLLGLLAVTIVLSVVFVIRAYAKKYTKPGQRLLLLSVVLPPVLLFIFSIPPFQPAYQDRYMSFFGPFFYSCIALGLLELKKPNRFIYPLATFFIVATMLFGQVNNYLYGNSHGWSPEPYFTINDLADEIATTPKNEPVYSTSLWTFFDAHITIRDRSVLFLVASYPTNWGGNYSAIYERPELITKTIPQDIKSFWLLDESGVAQYHGDALSGYSANRTVVKGYAKVVHYTRN